MKLDALLRFLRPKKARRDPESDEASGSKFDKKGFCDEISAFVADKGTNGLQKFLKSKVPAKRRDDFWNTIFARCTETVQAGEVFGEEDTMALKEDVEFLRTVVSMCENAIIAGCKVVQGLKNIVFGLNSLMLDIQCEAGSKLMDSISALSEKWYANELEDADNLMPQVITYLLARCTQHDATAAFMKRLVKVREALELLDYEDERIETTRHMIMRCAMSPMFLRGASASIGIQFLSSLFSLHPRIMRPLHLTIKNQIPYVKTSILKAYGEVYYGAWKAEEDEENYTRIEEACLQDLMEAAIHSSKPETAKNVRAVLGVIHSKKGEFGVDALLHRLWGPILFRSLKVANVKVRRNAVKVFSTLFPLVDPESKSQDVESEVLRQICMMDELMEDTDPQVRSGAVECVSRALGLYWELLPSGEAGKLLKKLVVKMANDLSSSSVRVAVVKGLSFMMENHLTHPVLKAVLPRTKNFIHDKSQSVRKAYVLLLEKVSSLKGIRFFDIVDMHNLLMRLRVEGRPVAKPLVRLLQASYFPHHRSSLTQLRRAIALAETPASAQVFYAHIHKFVPLKAICKFILVLGKSLACEEPDDEKLDRKEDAKDPQEDAAVQAAEKKACENKADRKESKGVISDVAEKGEVLLACMAQLWNSVNLKLHTKPKKKLRKYLEAGFTDITIATFLDKFGSKSEVSRAAIYKVITFLPSKKIPNITRASLEQLASLSAEAPTNVFGPLIDCVFSWEQHDGLVMSIAEAVEGFAEMLTKNRKNSEEFESSLALRFLDYIITKTEVRRVLILDVKLVQAVVSALAACVVSLQAVTDGEARCTNSDRESLSIAFRCHCKLLIHCSSEYGVSSDLKEEVKSEDVPSAIVKTLDLVHEAILPEVADIPNLDPEGHRSSKHRRQNDAKRRRRRRKPTPSQLLIHDTISFTVTFAADMVIFQL
ncbi:hypothetical protein AAMO2058_000500900 [Amorphochlora amoebiformis]